MRECDRSEIDNIMDCFGFRRVADVMEMLDWSWRDEGVPDEQTIRKSARRLLIDAIDGLDRGGTDAYVVETGGFRAEAADRVCPEEGPWRLIRLSFILESWDNTI